tara:strand:+ start:242 stop:1324 length:1083 start_codon:yes stop_codon:yes gene_type:complete
MKKLLLTFLMSSSLVILACDQSDPMSHDHSKMRDHSMHHEVSTVPISVMEAGTHEAGHFMIALRHMKMSMDRNSNRGDTLSDQEIISFLNPYSFSERMPYLSVVPKKMDMKMTMLESMYVPNDRYTFMLMANFASKEMSQNMYSPMGSREFLRTMNSDTSDLSNVSISSFIKLEERDNFRMNVEIGLDKSLGKNDITKNVINAMNMKTNMTLPYAMQSGDQSTCLLTAFTIVSKGHNINFGGQIKKKSPLIKKDWNFGDTSDLSFWLSKKVSSNASVLLNLNYKKIKKIEGRNLTINAPTQAADPSNYGGKYTNLSFGLNLQINHKNALGFEYLVPVKQDLNGPQMEIKNSFSLAYKLSI